MNSDSFTILNSERLLLRQIVQEDIHDIFKGLSHPEVIKYYGVSYKTLEETQEQIDWYRGLEENETGIYWAICSVDNSTFYGVGGLNNLDKKNKKTNEEYHSQTNKGNTLVNHHYLFKAKCPFTSKDWLFCFTLATNQ